MIKDLTREEKEKLYIKKMTELQIKWGNPVDDEWDFSDWTEEQLNKGLEDTIGQLRFEKGFAFLKKLFMYSLYIFVCLGVLGLLVFGIKQLF